MQKLRCSNIHAAYRSGRAVPLLAPARPIDGVRRCSGARAVRPAVRQQRRHDQRGSVRAAAAAADGKGGGGVFDEPIAARAPSNPDPQLINAGASAFRGGYMRCARFGVHSCMSGYQPPLKPAGPCLDRPRADARVAAHARRRGDGRALGVARRVDDDADARREPRRQGHELRAGRRVRFYRQPRHPGAAAAQRASRHQVRRAVPGAGARRVWRQGVCV